MAMSTIYVWITTCCDLFFSYFLACKLTKERVRKYARKGMEKESEFEIKRFQTFLFPLLVSLAVFVNLMCLYGGIYLICDDLPNKITGRWPVCEGTIVGWYDGYRGKGAAMIQVGDETKGYDIRNLNILEGEMVGVTVRMAYNRGVACILEHQENGNWVRERNLPYYGREAHAVQKTIAMNLLAGALTGGFVLKKLLWPEKTAFFKSKALRNVLGGSLLALTVAGEVLVCCTVQRFGQTWQGEEQMVYSQLFLLVLLYANMLFCILVTPKSTGYRYWWITAKEFFKELEEKEKK